MTPLTECEVEVFAIRFNRMRLWYATHPITPSIDMDRRPPPKLPSVSQYVPLSQAVAETATGVTTIGTLRKREEIAAMALEALAAVIAPAAR